MSAEGAAFRLVRSPWGDETVRGPWEARIAALHTLEETVEVLLEWRRDHRDEPVSDKDDLWIEARLEDKVAVLRFGAMTYAQVRNETLTGEKVADVRAAYLARAGELRHDSGALETLVSEFRACYRPPVMPSSPFMRTETELAETLMKAREKGWYRRSLEELREHRGVVVHKKGVNT